jgi:rhodanese-related sulfurtransferase
MDADLFIKAKGLTKVNFMKLLSLIARQLAMAGILILAMVLRVSADDPPPIPKDVKVITAEQLKKMLDNKDKFLLVDSRIANEFKDGHIPKAINVVDKEMETHKAKFPADKDYPIVFYCNGYPKCPRSVNGATTAIAWGYKNLSVYTAGIPDWEQKGLPLEKK